MINEIDFLDSLLVLSYSEALNNALKDVHTSEFYLCLCSFVSVGVSEKRVFLEGGKTF